VRLTDCVVTVWLTVHNFDIDIVQNNWVVVDTHADYSQVTIHSRQTSWEKKNKWMNSAQSSEFFMTHSLMPSDSYYNFLCLCAYFTFFSYFLSLSCVLISFYLHKTEFLWLPLLCNLIKLLLLTLLFIAMSCNLMPFLTFFISVMKPARTFLLFWRWNNGSF